MEEVFEKRSNLVMPTHYVELDSEEMSYVEGGGWFTDVCKWGGAILGGVRSCIFFDWTCAFFYFCGSCRTYGCSMGFTCLYGWDVPFGNG